MDLNACTATPSPETLMEVIGIQTEIAKLGLDLGGVMQLVADRLHHITGAAGAIVELAEGEEMVYRAASGIAAPQLGLRLKRTASLSGLCVETGKVLSCEDSESDPRVDREACRQVGLRSMVVSPLLFASEVVGVLKVVSEKPNFITDQHLCVLQLLSELIAATMYHSAKYEIKEIYYQATHDLLTGLANRALFYDRLRKVLALAGRQTVNVGVLYIDMDGLKTINDTHGHKAGDAAIREFAARAQQASRDSDTVARLGGDEFGVILADVDSRANAVLAAERLENTVGQPFAFEGAPLAMGASIGLALFPEDAPDMDSLIEMADHAMYQVKKTRKGHR